MSTRSLLLLGVVAIVLLGSMLTRVAVSAQGPTARNTRDVPVPVSDGAGKTVPIKVATRMYDRELLLYPPVLSEEAQTGRALWQQRCAYCHDGLGAPTYKTMGPWMGAETVQLLGEDAIRAYISTGSARMPAFKYGLDSQKINDVIAFLKTVPSSEKPTPGQLAGTSGGRGGTD